MPQPQSYPSAATAPPPPPRQAVAPPPPGGSARWPLDLTVAIALLVIVMSIGGVPEPQKNIFSWYVWEAIGSWASAIELGTGWLIILSAIAAVAVHRTRPFLALVLIWCSAIVQVFSFRDIFAIQIAAIIVAYGVARYGGVLLRWLGAVSIIGGALIGAAYLRTVDSWTLRSTEVLGIGYQQDLLPELIVVGELLAALALPFLLGLSLRFAGTSKRDQELRSRAEQEAATARELAALRTSRAQLANDVHDVVGHSLAVIIAQADSVRFLPDDDVPRIRQAMQNIADSARQSLGEIREVLQVTADHDAAASPPAHPNGRDRPLPGPYVGTVTTPGLDHLVETVSSAGHTITAQVSGQPRQLPTVLDTTSYRVLQEMLTNALKHGDQRAPITVDQRWDAASLTLTVTNVVRPEPVGGGGRGIMSMRERLARIGGELQVSTASTENGVVFVTEARLPFSSPAGDR